ncbi:MAG: hypothetical protein LBG72_04375, partial [Spirochaetaceae bacterium]|nr:hypothetical protein [Spirochaetaceae bacterium]
MKDTFSLVLDSDDSGPLLRFSGHAPDFRQYTGIEREVLRLFQTAVSTAARSFYIGIESFLDDEKGGNTPADVLRDPDERLLEQAVSARLLKNVNGETISAAGGQYHCVLQISGKSAAAVEVSPTLVDADGSLALEKKFSIVSPRLALHNDTLYTIDDIGIYWKQCAALWALIKKEDLTSYLSLVFSRFTNIELRYATEHGSGAGAWQTSWQTKAAMPVTAQPALLFMEIDKYEYLHVRPIAYLRDFPPEFLENEEIITAVKMNETEKIFTVAEVVFPEPSADLFRAAVARFARKGRMGKDGKGENEGKSGQEGKGVKEWKGGKADIQKQVYEENGRFIIAPDFAKQFFSENIFELSSQFVLLETRVLAGYKVSFSKPRLRLSLGTGIDYLAGSAHVE